MLHQTSNMYQVQELHTYLFLVPWISKILQDALHLNLSKLCNQSKINYEVDSLLLHKKIWTLCTWILHHSKSELWTRKPLSAILLFGRTATAMKPLRTWVCESVSVSWHCHSYDIMILTPVYKVMKILCPLVEASKCTHQVDNTLQNCVWQEVVRGESGAS
jgi:hypothetical protein